jgi:hypothetical protein
MHLNEGGLSYVAGIIAQQLRASSSDADDLAAL